MKSILLMCFTFVLSSLLFAKPAPKPEWVTNCNKTYPPRSEFIAMLGTGVTAENAKADATAAIARYFSSNVKVNISANQNYTEEKGTVQKKSTLDTSVQTESNMQFFGIEFTDPYRVKQEKKWYCAAFINMAEA